MIGSARFSHDSEKRPRRCALGGRGDDEALMSGDIDYET